MGLYNFQTRFVARVESGEKCHTIRAERKRPAVVGEMLHLYTGLRQKGARKLLSARCTQVEAIEISRVPGWPCQVFIEGLSLSCDEREQLALADGFTDWKDMLSFWAERLPFKGHIIHWNYPSEGA